MLWLIKLLNRRFTMARPLDHLAQVLRIKVLIHAIRIDATEGRWRKDTEKFDKEWEIKDRAAQANKAIKDRRGIKD